MEELSLDALERRRDELVKEIGRLREEVKRVKALYEKAKKLEDGVYEAMRKARSQEELAELEVRYHRISSKRRMIEEKLGEVEMKLRGAERELEEVKRRISYIKPRPARWVEERPG